MSKKKLEVGQIVTIGMAGGGSGPNPEVKRVPVKYRYDAIHPTFKKMLAEIGSYADEKYTSFAQYTQARLTGDKSPVNHIEEHLRSYVANEPYDHFEGDPRRHLAAIAYNAMMEFFYYSKWGPIDHPLLADQAPLGQDPRRWAKESGQTSSDSSRKVKSRKSTGRTGRK